MDHRPSEGILPGDMILPMTVLRIIRPLEGIPDPSMSRGNDALLDRMDPGWCRF